MIIPDTQDVQAEINMEWQNVFGADLILTPNTPQGLLITTDVLARQSTLLINAAVANQINPNLAGGVFLDALWALTGGQRDAATFSIATVTLTGVAGTVIPTNVTAANATGDIFQIVNSVTLNGGGTATASFQAQVAGPIGAPSGTLIHIINGVLGWETITNPADAILGTATQSDASARAERRQTLALQGDSMPLAIISGLLKTAGVTSLAFRENVTSSTVVIDTITLVPHSMYACVAGGTDLDVATTILNKKSGGCDYNGSTIVNVTDVASGQIYSVAFDRPTPIPIYIKATVRVINALGDVASLVTQAILDYANGVIPGEDGFAVGKNVSCFELAAAVNEEIIGIYIQNMQTTLASPFVYSNAEIVINPNQQAATAANQIVVVVI